MARFGWTGIVIFGIVLGLVAAAIHWRGDTADKRVPGGTDVHD
jgi:hypothetical protein